MTTPAKVDGPALREATVRDYKRNAERAGLPVDMALIEAAALADCNTYAAVMRDDRPRAVAEPDPAKEAEKAGALAREVSEACPGAEVLDEPVQSVPIPLFHDRPKADSKWAAANSRCAAILRGANPHAYAHPGASIAEIRKAMCATCEIPELAEEIDNLRAHWGLYMATGGRGTLECLAEVNHFAGLSLTDAARKYRRLIEDICDRSEAKLGSWWTRGITYDRVRGKR